jgi:hypothetical protein
MKTLFTLVLVFGIVMAVPLAEAAQSSQSGEYVLDPVIVTARGYATSQSDTPSSEGIATEKEISLAPKGSIVDALELIPGRGLPLGTEHFHPGSFRTFRRHPDQRQADQHGNGHERASRVH